jgi:protein AATF/BFR2
MKDEVYVVKAMNQLIELQQRLFVNESDTSYIIQTDQNDLKRKRSSNSEEEEEEEEEDESDEEIYSDTDEENAANEAKKLKKKQKTMVQNFNFKPLEPNNFEMYLNDINKKFKKYRDQTIQKWYDKTRLTTGKSFKTVEKPMLQQIEHVKIKRNSKKTKNVKKS